jgi:Kef-type K+ transport system membrane component KefB
MTYYLIISLCVIIIVSYIFDITSKYTRIPGVILLILSGLGINYLFSRFNVHIPDLFGLLPVMGTLGLILIVLEGSLDLTVTKNKKRLITQSVLTALVLFVVFEAIFATVLVYFLDAPLQSALINTIPLGIISSAVAIPSASSLSDSNREFVIYESSFSDILGILIFDFVLINFNSLGKGILGFTAEILMTLIGGVLISAGLAYILHKTKYHVKNVLITTVIVLIYALTKLIHMPSLLVVLIFGLIMNNYHLIKNRVTEKFIDFKGFTMDLASFKHITGELTFIVRSFFFIIFGYYSNLNDLLNINNLVLAVSISLSIFVIRAFFFVVILKESWSPLIFFAPRGLITILLYLGIPASFQLPFMNQGLITQIIFITILIMTFGNFFSQKLTRI